MYLVKGKYIDGNTCYFYLNTDKSFNDTAWQAPINWQGTVNGQKVEFTQIEEGAYNTSCFDWLRFPTELTIAKTHIVKAIDEAMRTMD